MRRPVASIPSKRMDVSYYHYYFGPSASYLHENGHAQEVLSAEGLNPGQVAAFAGLSSGDSKENMLIALQRERVSTCADVMDKS